MFVCLSRTLQANPTAAAETVLHPPARPLVLLLRLGRTLFMGPHCNIATSNPERDEKGGAVSCAIYNDVNTTVRIGHIHLAGT